MRPLRSVAPADLNRVLERRFIRNDSNQVTCRICFARVDLDLTRIDETPMYVYHRCQACDQWFTIRREDLARLLESQQEVCLDGVAV